MIIACAVPIGVGPESKLKLRRERKAMSEMKDEVEVQLTDIVRPGVSRGLDFVIVDELRKRTGITPQEVLKFALAEMVCNGLDKQDATEINVEVETEGEFHMLGVSDNGDKKLTVKELRLILDFENKASSKRGFLRVSRGYLGNALKCIFGYSYALAESKGLNPPDIVVKSANHEYTIVLKPDKVREVIKSKIGTAKRKDDGFTTFIVKFPKFDVREEHHPSRPSVLKDLIFATSMVNPSRKITYNIFGEEGSLGSAEGGNSIRNETSVLWYTGKQFLSLYKDFVRATPDAKLKGFIPLFRGFTSKKVIGEILQELTTAVNHDSKTSKYVQFLPATPIKDLSVNAIVALFKIMRAKAKPISKRSVKSVLGCIGEGSFEKLREQHGWQRLRYVIMPAIRVECPEYYHHDEHCDNLDHVEFPYLIELAVFDRKQDGEGLKVYQCVNFMASMEDLFSRIFDISYRLGMVGITEETPVTVVAHLVCPVLRWLNYGKSSLDEEGEAQTYGWGDRISNLMEKAFNKILPIPKTPRVYHPPPPPRPVSWVPHGRLGDHAYEGRLEDFASEILAIDSQRTKRVKYSSRGWCYLLEGLGKIHKGEFDACQRAINDCRKIGLLPIDFVAEDQDVTRRFMGIHTASDPGSLLEQLKRDVAEMLCNLPSYTTDYWTDEKYYVMTCVEKGDILNLFKPVCDEYHVPIVNSKGWAPILLRAHIATLSQRAEANGLTPVLLLFYDHDPAGLKITNRFRENLRDCEGGTGWSPDKLIIERFGLNKDDIDRYSLTWIENLKTSSGRESRDYDYIRKYGTRKCESNALFKNDETLKAGEEICRKAIEKYYGNDAKERFKKKEENSKQKLKPIYDVSVWKNFYAAINELIDCLAVPKPKREPSKTAAEKEVEVAVDDKYYGKCPKCGASFDYAASDVGRLVRCRTCNLPMRLKWKSEAEGG
jgi:hypothetical protein